MNKKNTILLFFGTSEVSTAFAEHLKSEGFKVRDIVTHIQLKSEMKTGEALAIFMDETASGAGDFDGRKTQTYQNTATLILDDIKKEKLKIAAILVSSWIHSPYRHEEKRLFAAFYSTEIFKDDNWPTLMERLKFLQQKSLEKVTK